MHPPCSFALLLLPVVVALGCASPTPPADTSGPPAASTSSIGELSDDMPASCGCFVWRGDKILVPGKLVYQELSTNERDYLQMSLGGAVVDLKKQGDKPGDKLHANAVGDVFTDALAGTDWQVQARWQATEVNPPPPDDAAARNAKFSVALDVTGPSGTEHLVGVGYCGC